MIPHINESKDDFEDIEIKYQHQPLRRAKWQQKILLNRPLHFTLVFLLLGVVSPLLLYHLYFLTSYNLPPPDGYSTGSCVISRSIRIPCGIGFVPEEESHPQCCYDGNSHMSYHRIPSRFSYIMNEPWNEYVILHPRVATVPYSNQNSIPKMKLSIDEESATHMIMTLYNARNESKVGKRTYDKKYSYRVTSPELNIVVNGTQGPIFNMDGGPLIASDNIWEISFTLTNESLYGFGEIPITKNSTRIIYQNGAHNSVPLIFAKIGKNFHGLLIDISDPTEVTVTLENQILIRSITNYGLKLHLFTGPEPRHIMNDVRTVIGNYSKLEYWMLGVHICNEVPQINLTSFIADANKERMPYDSICGDGPIVFNSDQCADSESSNIAAVNNGANLVRNAGRKFVPHVSPYIRYQKANLSEEENERSINETIKNCHIIPTFEEKMYRFPKTMDLYTGKVDDYDVVYPSYDEESDVLMKSLWAYTDELDGVILENNWPFDQSEKKLNETTNYLPYFNEIFQEAFNHTPQWNLTLVNNSNPYLFKHNKYGDNFAKKFSKLSNDTLNIWSSSLWMNGRFAINRQNINASWTNLHKELLASALGGISGSWLWSTPICGDNENFNPESQIELCIKWYMAATYFPMIKIHSKKHARYPFAYNGTHKSLMMTSLKKRMELLPYFYTTLQVGPLLRPMFYQFPSSVALHNINTQFSVGDNLLIAPNLQPMQSHVHIWLPPGTWYEFSSGLELKGNEGDPVTMTTTESDFLTFIRGGSIVLIQRDPTQMTAEQSRFLDPFSAIIALECSKHNGTDTCKASGKQYFTPGMALHFSANETTMIITAEGTDFDPICNFNTGTWAYDIRDFSIYGLHEKHNNYDHRRQFQNFIDLCNLRDRDEIFINLL
ncbi:unnamed protein product, partial [Brenthis ino]